MLPLFNFNALQPRYECLSTRKTTILSLFTTRNEQKSLLLLKHSMSYYFPSWLHHLSYKLTLFSEEGKGKNTD
jgi:hypothetical protein